MMVIFTSRSEKKAIYTVRRILDSFADRIGNDTWKTVITQEGLLTVQALLRRTATKSTAVACHWIRSRSHSELVWIVGKRDMFNEEGIVPVHSTQKEILHHEWENDWQYLPLIKALAAVAALFHDWGKASALFQEKLDKGTLKMDPFRHEWVSCKLLEALIFAAGAEKDDRKWLKVLAERTIKTEDIEKNLQIDEKGNGQADMKKLDAAHLPPIAKFLMWLMLSHHRLPSMDKDGWVNVEKKSFHSIFSSLNASWGYESEAEETIMCRRSCFVFPEGLLVENAAAWRKAIKKWCGRLLNDYDRLMDIMGGETYKSSFRAIAHYTRLSLMLADHYVSSLPEETDKGRWAKNDLWANTDGKTGKKKQFLEEHLVRVCEQATHIAHRLPYFSDQMESVYDVKALAKKSPAVFRWQDTVVEKIRAFREKNGDGARYFIVNMASTGCGKTFANAKIMQAVSTDGKSLRYILALGLRTLTLQTGDEYRERIHLDRNDLAVLIGSSAVTKLHEENKEADKEKAEEKKGNRKGYLSEEPLLPEELEYVDTESEEQSRFLDIFFNKTDKKGMTVNEKTSKKNKAFLYKPVLAATIDHMMGAVETTRGGRYILPSLRLMSSDLVIDEIDDFNSKDLIAIARLVHLAGLCGRNVAISSATIQPDLAEGLYRSYQAGLKSYNSFFTGKKQCALVLCDEFRTDVEPMDSGDDSAYRKIHDRFIRKRVENLGKEPVKRRGYIQFCGAEDNDTDAAKETSYFENIREAIEKLHENHHVIDKRTKKRISFGVVRVANITPCVKVSLYLMKCGWSEGTAVRVMTYHSRQILLLRHEQERYLDKVFTRKTQSATVDFQDETVRKHLDSTPEENIIFILVATPVEEVGRDHDFDWAVVEPSSYRSIIQLAGRVLRHRQPVSGTLEKKNMAIMAYNLKAWQGKEPAYSKPGYETEKRKLNSYDMHDLVDEEELGRRIDAVPRILKPEMLDKEQFCPDDKRYFSKLSDLEHASMMDFNCKEDCGPQCMHGWMEEYWWMTALPQGCSRFRESYGEEIKACAVYEEGERKFLVYEGKENTLLSDSVGITDYSGMTEEMEGRLWIIRDYEAALRRYVSDTSDVPQDVQMNEVSCRYGEITIPYGRSSTVDEWKYSDQLGMFKLTEENRQEG